VIWLKSVDPQTPQKGLRPRPTMPAAVRTPQSAPSARKGGICKCCRSVRSMRDGRQMNIRTCGKLHPCLKAFSADEAERLEAHRVVHNRCEHAVWLAQASTAKPIRLDRGNNITLAGNFWEVSSDGHKQSSQDFADWLKTARTEPSNQRRGGGVHPHRAGAEWKHLQGRRVCACCGQIPACREGAERQVCLDV